MDEHILQAMAGHPEMQLAIPYVRGLMQLIQQHRLDLILARTNRCQRRRRRMLASSVVWLVIAMSLFAKPSIPMVWRSLHPYSPEAEPDESAFTKARQRLGVAPLRELFREIAPTLAPAQTPGVFYRSWRLMGLDGTTFDMPDTPENDKVFGRGGNQRSPNAFPHVRVLALCELGTHAVTDFALRPINHGEQVMVPHLVPSLQPGMLLLWDRNFFGFKLIQSVLSRGAHLLARVKISQLIFERLQDLPDGSYLSCIYPSHGDRLKKRNGRIVRIIEYTHNDPDRVGCGKRNRLLTDVLDPAELPALEAPVVYHQRWEQELVFDEIKTHLNDRAVKLRSKTPRGVVQELYGLFLAHRVIRQVMSDAAARAKPITATGLSFTDSLRILQNHLHEAPTCDVETWYQRVLEEVRRQTLRARRNRWYPRVIKRKMKKWRRKRACHANPTQPTKPFDESILIT
jgi:Insertion element 4 transposase N-terminal/Transposase DDE domain